MRKPYFKTQEGQTLLKQIRENDPSMTSLYLGNKNIDDTDIQTLSAVLKSNCALTHIYLSGNEIGDAGAKYIADMLDHQGTITDLSTNIFFFFSLFSYNNQIQDKASEARIDNALKRNRDWRDKLFEACRKGDKQDAKAYFWTLDNKHPATP